MEAEESFDCLFLQDETLGHPSCIQLLTGNRAGAAGESRCLCHARPSRFIFAQSAWDMANTADHPRSSPPTLERRHHPRGKIDEVNYVYLLDRENGGLALNISEAGLLLQTARKVVGQEVSRIRFRPPATDQWIEARVRFVWVGESGKEAGVQFLELPEVARSRIEEWVAKGALPRVPAGNSPTGNSGQLLVETAATVATPPGSVRQNRDGPPPSFAQPRSAKPLPWRGLAKVVCWVAVAVIAVLFGLRYSQRLPQLPILGGSKQAPNSAIGPTKAVQSPSANAATRSPAGSSQSESTGPPLKPSEGGTVPVPHAQNSTESILGNMLTQTLSPAPIAAGSNSAAIPSQAQRQQHAKSSPEPSDTPPSTHTDAPERSHSAILVGAPPVGAPPAHLILESEPVNASSRVAITASRSILVPGSKDPTKRLQLGKLVSYVDPVYPADALEKGVEGTVKVRAFVGRSGEVLSLRLLSGPEVLAPAAMSAVRQWRFGQTLLNGKAIESQADVNVFFRLH